MHTLMLMSPKGGAGKSTMSVVIAGELSNAGKTVVMIDADPNFPLYGWKSLNQSPDNISVSTDDDPEGGTIQATIAKAQSESDFVIIDTEGTANRRVQIAALQADLIIIPFNPSPLDIAQAAKAVGFLDTLSRETGQTIHYLLAPTQMEHVGTSKATFTAIQQVRDAGKPIITNALMRRETFRAMFQYGATLYTLTAKESSGVAKTRINAQEFVGEVMAHYKTILDGEKAVA